MNRYRIIPIEKIEKWYDISNQGYLVSKSTGEHVYGAKNKYGYSIVTIAGSFYNAPLKNFLHTCIKFFQYLAMLRKNIEQYLLVKKNIKKFIKKDCFF